MAEVEDMEREEAGEGEDGGEEEYNVWKKNTPFLYDLVASHCLEWPSLTLQWLPSSAAGASGFPTIAAADDGSFSVRRIIFGTFTSDEDPNYLIVADVAIPCHGMPLPGTASDGDAGSDAPDDQMSFVKMINHDGEINKARYMPQNPSLIATKTVTSDIYVFDYSKHPAKSPEKKCRPDIILKGHTEEGFGLSWNPFKKGLLLSGSRDCQICLWDISSTTEKVLHAKDIYKCHRGEVGDVSWHCTHGDLFGSVGDDHQLMIWDLRASIPNKPIDVVEAHKDEINCLAFSPFNEFVLATGAGDKTINLFDMRKLALPLHTLHGHTDKTMLLEWSPIHDGVLASGAADKKVILWDISRIGDEQSPEDAEDGPPELLFIHGGHTERVTDIAWSQDDDWVISSVAEDNTLQIWKLAKGILGDDSEII